MKETSLLVAMRGWCMGDCYNGVVLSSEVLDLRISHGAGRESQEIQIVLRCSLVLFTGSEDVQYSKNIGSAEHTTSITFYGSCILSPLPSTCK